MADDAKQTQGRFAVRPAMVVQEFGGDDDVDESVIEELESGGAEVVGRSYGDVTDAALVWWRTEDGDAADLADLLVDALTPLEEGPIWVLTPKSGVAGHVRPDVVTDAASTAGLNTTSTFATGGDWVGYRLTSRRR